MAEPTSTLPFSEQINFFRRKLNLPTESWTDIYAAEHDWAFVVAGANRNEIVADFRVAVERAIAEGGTLEDFRRDFDRIVAIHGWDYNGGRAWRSRVIYETNLLSSYQAGRYEQLMAMRETHPYWMYVHADWVEDPRKEHLDWNGLVLRWDDPWWQTHFPINAWGCHCSVIALSEADIQKRGLKIGKAPPEDLEERTIGQRSLGGPRTVTVPKGIDPGFEYTPGKSRLVSAIPPPVDDDLSGSGVPGVPGLRASDPLPPSRSFPAQALLSADLSDEQYADAFLQAFGATISQPAIFTDVVGERLVIGDELFTQARNGEWDANKNGQGQFIPLLAETLKSPDEIWARVEWHADQRKAVVRRRYISRWNVSGIRSRVMSVFEIGPDGWTGVTTFSVGDVDGLRIGARIYRREP